MATKASYVSSGSTGSSIREDSLPRRKRPWRKPREAKGPEERTVVRPNSGSPTDLTAAGLSTHPLPQEEKSTPMSAPLYANEQFGGGLEAFPSHLLGLNVPVEVDGSVMEGVSLVCREPNLVGGKVNLQF